ncbi:putative LRR containing protein [Trachipleistophora hominis]|uniref:Putative LRR containing protein n=1 Tax=Trachipleistophora hominis TaxID=72359 RepID=L7JVD9_TRAHO|nr:putative LRR containing protein [Trachipleistophora hominis]
MFSIAKKKTCIVIGYILIFYSPDKFSEKEYIIIKDLKETRLEKIFMFSDVTNSEMKASMIKKYDYDDEKDEFGLFSEFDQQAHCSSAGGRESADCTMREEDETNTNFETAQIRPNVIYKALELPITLTLYSKLQKLTPETSQVKLANNEIYHCLIYLLFIWEKPEIIAFIVCNHLQDDPTLYEWLLAGNTGTNMSQEEITKNKADIYRALMCLGTIVRSNIEFIVTGRNFGEESACSRFTTNQVLPRMYLLLSELRIGIFINYLSMKVRFLEVNDDLLAEKFEYYKNESQLEVQINFVQPSQAYSSMKNIDEMYRQMFLSLANSKFLYLENVVKINLNFGEIDFTPYFDVLTGLNSKIAVITYKHPNGICYNAIPSAISEISVSFLYNFSQNCACYCSDKVRELSISDAKIPCNLSLGTNTQVFKAYDIEICSEAVLVLDHRLKLVSIMNVNGDIEPCENGCYNTIYLLKSKGGNFYYESKEEVILRISGAEINNLLLTDDVTEIILDSITISEENQLRLNVGFKNLSIQDCCGKINFSGFMNLFELTFVETTVFVYEINKDTRRTEVLIERLALDSDTNMNLLSAYIRLVAVDTCGHILVINCKNHSSYLHLKSCVGNFVLVEPESLKRLNLEFDENGNFSLDYEGEFSMLTHLYLSYNTRYRELVERIVRSRQNLEVFVFYCPSLDNAEESQNRLPSVNEASSVTDENISGNPSGEDGTTRSDINVADRALHNEMNALLHHFLSNTSVQNKLRSLDITNFPIINVNYEMLEIFTNLDTLCVSFFFSNFHHILERLPATIMSLTVVGKAENHGKYQKTNIGASTCIKLRSNMVLRKLRINGCFIENLEMFLANLPMRLEVLSVNLSKVEYKNSTCCSPKVYIIKLVLNFFEECPPGLFDDEVDEHGKLRHILSFLSQFIHFKYTHSVICTRGTQRRTIDPNIFSF